MTQTNYTPIALYYSTTAAAVPTSGNLVPGELGLNINDMKQKDILFFSATAGAALFRN